MGATRRFLLLLLIPACSRAQLEQDDTLRRQAVEFDKHWGLYLRNLFGCEPTGPTTEETCDPSRGYIDYASFSKARDLAKKIFQLREK